jgi:Protein of unknown function (DUF2849)
VSKRAPDNAVLTANRLHDGIVVYLAADGRWVESIEAAVVAHSPEEASALQEHGARDSAANLVVEPYLAEVAEAGGRRVPARMRERVRVEGPSILDDVPGYVATPSPRATPTSPRIPSARGEGRGEGQPNTPTPVIAAAPHPNPPPASGERESSVEAA